MRRLSFPSSRSARIATVAGVLMLALSSFNVTAAIDIHAAIRAGDTEAVQAAAKDGAELNRPDAWGRTPLIIALQQGKQALVELLLDRGASTAAADAWGRTPLLVATQLKNTAAIRLLLDRKADVDAANRNDITPLIAAAQTGNREALAMLLAAGATPERADNLGWTALMWAAYRKDAVSVRMLLDKGADVSAVGRDKSTALDIAKARGADDALVALLAERSTPPSAGKPAATVTRAAAPKPSSGAGARRLSPIIDPERIVRGNPRAPITIVEYTDFQCPYCRFGARTIAEVMARYEGQVRLVVKQLPLPLLHPMAMSTARYFEAISLQSADRAWAFYDRIFADQGVLAEGEPGLRKIAAALGVDVSRLEHDLQNPVTQRRIDADLEESQRFRFDGVPAFVVNGEVIEGAQPAEKFFAVIDAALRQ